MPEKSELKRAISLPLLTYYGLGNILGAGIYVLVGKVASTAGILAPISFLIASLLAAFTAFSYAELSSRYPTSAGESVYIHEGYGKRYLSLGVGLLIVLAGMLSSAAIVQGFVGYLQVFVKVPGELVIVGLVFLLALVAAWGINESVRAAALLTLLEVVGLLMILWTGQDALAQLPDRWHEFIPSGNWMVWHGVLLGALLAFYAYIGFEDMVNVAEEVKSPERNMPLAIIIALIVSGLLYVLISLVAVLSLPVEKLAVSDAPLALIYEQNTQQRPVVITLIGMFAVINGALIQIIMVSRILYGLSRKGWLHNSLGIVHPATHTPLRATLVSAAGVLLFALSADIAELAENTSFVILIVFVLVNGALIRIKRKDPMPLGIKTFPMWVPVTGLVFSLCFVVFRTYNFFV